MQSQDTALDRKTGLPENDSGDTIKMSHRLRTHVQIIVRRQQPKLLTPHTRFLTTKITQPWKFYKYDNGC